MHYVHGHLWSFITKTSNFDSVSCQCLTPSHCTPTDHKLCCSFKAWHPGSIKSYLGFSWAAQVTKCVTVKNQQKEKRLRLQKRFNHLKAVWDSQGVCVCGNKNKCLAVLSREAKWGFCCSSSRCCSTDMLQTWVHLHLRSALQCLTLLILLNSQALNKPCPRGSCQATLAHLTD